MNKHILFVMRSLDNPKLFAQEEKEANNRNAADAAANAAYAAYDAYDAAADAADAAPDSAADAEYWVNIFFERTGEDKQVYINEVERLKGNNTMQHNELDNLDTHIMTCWDVIGDIEAVREYIAEDDNFIGMQTQTFFSKIDNLLSGLISVNEAKFENLYRVYDELEVTYSESTESEDVDTRVDELTIALAESNELVARQRIKIKRLIIMNDELFIRS